MKTIHDVSQIDFQRFNSKEAYLVPYRIDPSVSFTMANVFTVTALEKVTRGFHAHKACNQLLVTLQGSCQVVVKDGQEQGIFELNKPEQGLLIPATLWAEQRYEPNTILMVMTDKPFDEADYIRQYDTFLEFRKLK